MKLIAVCYQRLAQAMRLRHGWLMAVAVVNVGIMSVTVSEGNMLVPVTMRLGQRHCAAMFMEVVFIVHMAVFMHQPAVLMVMPVPLRQIKNNTSRCQ
jgi:hypothetical protein